MAGKSSPAAGRGRGTRGGPWVTAVATPGGGFDCQGNYIKERRALPWTPRFGL